MKTVHFLAFSHIILIVYFLLDVLPSPALCCTLHILQGVLSVLRFEKYNHTFDHFQLAVTLTDSLTHNRAKPVQLHFH